MSKLINQQESSKYFPYREEWLLKNGLTFAIFYYENNGTVAIDSDSGDVANQIYDILITYDQFRNVKLSGGSCYFIKIDKSLIKEVMDFVEKIDITTLKEGKSY